MHLKDRALVARGYSTRGLELSLGIFEQDVERLVIMRGIMMERDKFFRTHLSCKLKSMPVGAVSPPYSVLIFLVGILRVMNQQISTGREIVARCPLGCEPSTIS